jgi:hypothetical protein
MATPTYDLIETTTLASAASSVTFSSITQDYRDLVLVLNLLPDASFPNQRLRLNGDSGSNYNRVTMSGNGSTAGSISQSGLNAIFSIGPGSSVVVTNIFEIMDYSATDKHKTVLARTNRVDFEVTAAAHRWANTSAVTSVETFATQGSYPSGSTFSLYGIAS